MGDEKGSSPLLDTSPKAEGGISTLCLNENEFHRTTTTNYEKRGIKMATDEKAWKPKPELIQPLMEMGISFNAAKRVILRFMFLD